jgi:antitoxin component YwqK of YwqJK toxin-antitoxin module
MRKIYVPLLSFSALLMLLSGCQQTGSYYVSDQEVVDETYVHRYGVPVSPQDWSASGNHGQIVTTLANGVVVTKSYSAGILDGNTTYSYPHSSAIEKVETYSNGVLQKESSYYIAGALKQEVFYNTPQNRTVTTWYETGSPKSKEQFQGNLLFQATYFGQNNQTDSQVANYSGSRTRRDDYGQLLSVDAIDNGLIAQRTTYHPNGSPSAVIPYANGSVHGQVKTYFPAGEPRTVEEWSNGSQSGLAIEYLNGEKVGDCNYINGQKQGIEHRYRDGKTVVQEISWANGQKHGPSTTYVGAVIKTDWFLNGKQVSKSNYDMITGPGAKKTIWSNPVEPAAA